MKINKHITLLFLSIFLLLSACDKNDNKLENITLIDNAEVRLEYSTQTDEIIKISPPLKAGEQRVINVKSLTGANIEFTAFGESENPPKMLITAFVTKGAKKRKDYIELCCTESGNPVFYTLRAGKYTFTFNSARLGQNEKIVLYPEPTLSMNNGHIILYSSPSPFARVVDSVYYTNKGAEGDIKDNWSGEGVDSTPSSSVKAFRRKTDKMRNYIDTNCKKDWEIY